MTRWRCGWGWFGFALPHREYYDGPFWCLNLGVVFFVWSLDGLPRIFERRP